MTAACRGYCVLAALLVGAVALPARAQSSDPAPYLHTAPAPSPHHPLRHAAKRVPVLAPHHAGSPRHAPRAASIKSATKGGAAKTPAGAVPVPTQPAQKPAQPAVPPNIGPSSGLPLPRYASLKSDQVNMRTGPGERYPVKWTYQRRDLPVKIEHEFDIWRQVEDMDGEKGWMQQGFLAGHRSFVVTGTDDRTMRADASDTADAVAILKPGVVGRIKSCDAGKDWCQVQVQDYRGWLKRSDFWGTDPNEAVAP